MPHQLCGVQAGQRGPVGGHSLGGAAAEDAVTEGGGVGREGAVASALQGTSEGFQEDCLDAVSFGGLYVTYSY